MAGLQLTKNTMWNLVQIYRSLSAHKTGGYLMLKRQTFGRENDVGQRHQNNREGFGIFQYVGKIVNMILNLNSDY